jgi:hypothetical protein
MSKDTKDGGEPSSYQEFQDFHARIKANNEDNEARRRSLPAQPAKPAKQEWTETAIKEFCARKIRESAGRTPKQVEALREDYLQRRAEIAERVKQQNAAELKTQPGYRTMPDATLFRIAEMRVELKRELIQSEVKASKANAAIAKFDWVYSRPENLKTFEQEVKEQLSETQVKPAAKASQGHGDLEIGT